MGKIKKQTREQREIHNRAVKIRKMTDEEVVKRFDASATVTIKQPESPEDRAALERTVSERLSGTMRMAQVNTEELDPEAMTRAACVGGCSTKEFLQALEAAHLCGIGKITIKKISEFAKEKGYI